MVLLERTDQIADDIICSDIIKDVKMEESQIQKLYAGSSVFITGGTGFLGKLLVEKLLRSCPDIKKLYLLTRPKKNKDVLKRLQEQFDDQLYDKLKKQMPDFIKKIDIIEGDVGHLELGISEDDRAKIIKEVEFIFHAAATVRFDEPIKTAVDINVRGSREILKLARACTKLRACIHVSTAYSNCLLKEIDEKFYDAPIDGEKLIDLVENMDQKTLDNITPGLLGDFPNSYIYTKLVAEDIVQKNSKGLPVAVFRPSIVIGTANEPLKGWIDNIYGPTGVVVGAGVGLLHVLNCNPKVIADLIPGDMVVHGCIAAAWKTAKDYPGNHEEAPVDQLPTVYNYVSSEQVPISWGKNNKRANIREIANQRFRQGNFRVEKFMKCNEVHGLKVPSQTAIWVYLLLLIPSKFMSNFYTFFLHWIPAYIIDAVLMLIGKKPMLRKAYKKIEKFSAVISYFALREWKFHNSNTQNLHKILCKADKEIFKFNMESVNWNEYFKAYISGVRIYLLKDPLDTLPQARIRYYRLRLLNYFVVGLLCFVFMKLFIYLTRLLV